MTDKLPEETRVYVTAKPKARGRVIYVMGEDRYVQYDRGIYRKSMGHWYHVDALTEEGEDA